MDLILIPRSAFEEILREAEEHHPRPHYRQPLVECAGPGKCADELRFALAHKLLDLFPKEPSPSPNEGRAKPKGAK
jgi:hypothetical protein